MSIKILIVDDHTLLRETWKFILNADARFEVVSTCQNGEDAVRETKRLSPRIVIMDINLPGINGIETARAILNYDNKIKILGYSLHYEFEYVNKIIEVGAAGYITKMSTQEEVFEALLAINNNEYYFTKDLNLKQTFSS